MLRKSSNPIDESTLTKMQLRKLNALRRSVGDEIGVRVFAEWLSSLPQVESRDGNAELIADALWPLVKQGKLAFRRGGYLVKRGRGRIVDEPAKP